MHSFLKSLGSKSKSSTYPNHNISAPLPALNFPVDQLGRLATFPLPAALADHLHQSPSQFLSDSSSFPISHDPEFQLIYGYIGLHTEIECDILTTSQSVNLIARELQSRALETPLLFSTHALDISSEVTHSLIRTYVQNPREFFQYLPLYDPHNLAAMLKWILSRHVNSQDTHGFIKWEQYAAWRDSEPTFGYPPKFLTTHFLSQLSPPVASLLSCLLDLFTSASLRADVTGMTVHKCATLFGSYIFGLEHDQTFEHTYSHWLRYSHATEHLIFAHMRDLKARSPTGRVPLRMENYLKGYPSTIPSLTAPHPSARLEKVARFRKITSSYNPNLIASAGTWMISRSKTWDRLKPYPEISAAQYLNNKKAGISKEPSKLLFSQSFKHLLNIGSSINFDDDEDSYLNANFEGPQRFKSLIEKEWSGFMSRGFQEPDAKKLQFNLEESFNAQLKMKRGTMDWDSFSDAGFIGRETYQAKELEFNSDIQKSCDTSSSASIPPSKKSIAKKLMKTAKSPSVFAFDTTPYELPPQSVDDNFFEAWADVLVASGWCRDEPKEMSWVLLHCKCKAVDHQDFEFRPIPLNPDGRNEEMWTLFEEVVPKEHQLIHQNASTSSNSKVNRRSFLRAIIRKDHKKPSSADKLPSVPSIPSHFFSGPTDSSTRRDNTSQSSLPQALPLTSSFDTSPTASPMFPNLSAASMGKLLTISNKMHTLGASSQTTSADPLHSTAFDTSTIDLESLDSVSQSSRSGHRRRYSDKWLVVSAGLDSQTNTRPILRTQPSLDDFSYLPGFQRVEKDHLRSYDQPIHYTSSSLSPRPASSTSSATTQTSDPDDTTHDGQRLSDNSRSTTSSDFTVELVERLVEPPASLGVPSLLSMRSFKFAKGATTSNDHSSLNPYSRATSSVDTITSRSLEYDSKVTTMYTSSADPSRSNTFYNSNAPMSIGTGSRTWDELEKLLDDDSNLGSPQERFLSRQVYANQSEVGNKENISLASSMASASYRGHDHQLDKIFISHIPSISSQFGSSAYSWNKHTIDHAAISDTSPLKIKSSELGFNPADQGYDQNDIISNDRPSVYSQSMCSNALDSLKIETDQDCWFGPLDSLASFSTALDSPPTRNSHSNPPPHRSEVSVDSAMLLPGRVNLQSNKISSIVDMFEKGQPGPTRITK